MAEIFYHIFSKFTIVFHTFDKKSGRIQRPLLVSFRYIRSAIS